MVARLLDTPFSEMVLCSVVKAELELGAIKGRYERRSIELMEEFIGSFHSFPFDDSCAKTYATIRSGLERLGMPIGANDLLIAAIAISNNLTLVTANVDEFSRIGGLRLENWEGP